MYDEFGYGLAVPEAIQGFLRYALPAYAVLVGDGNYDPKNYLKAGGVNYFPVYLAAIDPWMGETFADNRYACVSGADRWPDLFLGRLPVNSLAQANEMVDKTMAYEQTMGGQGWNGHLTFVADIQPDPRRGQLSRSLGRRGQQLCPALLYHLQGLSRHDRRLDLRDRRRLQAAGLRERDQCRNTAGQFRRPLGADAVVWLQILELPAIGSLTNANRYPIMLPFTCLEGYFIWPYAGTECLGEALVRATDKGAVASWSPAGLGVTDGHDSLNKGFFQAVLHAIFELGPATYAAKLRLYNTGANLDQIDTYHVFGDPALRINHVSYADVRMEKTVEAVPPVLPGDAITYTLTFTNAGPRVAAQVVLTDLIPALFVNPTVVYTTPNVLAQRPGPAFSWTIADLPPHTGGQVKVRATVDPAAVPPVSVLNEARIMAQTADKYLANNVNWAHHHQVECLSAAGAEEILGTLATRRPGTVVRNPGQSTRGARDWPGWFCDWRTLTKRAARVIVGPGKGIGL